MTEPVEDDIARLEMAAVVILAPPNQVTAVHRKEAEKIFLDLKENLLSFEIYSKILETTQNHFVMFEIAQVFGKSVLKRWHRLSEEEVVNICMYLLQFPVTRLNLPNFVIAEIFRSLSMILKRSSVDTDILNSDFLANSIEGFIHSDNEQLQSLGLQVIESIAIEFSTNWRSSSAPISWDFNTRAKKQFENILLKNFLKLSLSTLSQLFSYSDFSSPLHLKICDKFMRVAVIVLSWNFSPKLVAIRLRAFVSVLKSSSFRPPSSWNDFFQDASIITFFMQLHSRVRHNEHLCINSLNCLTQLASVMGDVLGPIETESSVQLSPTSSRGQHNSKTHDLYVQTFVSNLINLFTQLHEYEMLPVSVVIYKLFTYHPITVFRRFSIESMSRFVVFVSDTIIKLTGPAIEYSILKNEQTYHEALSNLYNVWRCLIRNESTFLIEVSTLIVSYNTAIFEEFLKTILAPPYGTRQLVVEDELANDNDVEEDDRDVFMNVLGDLAYFSMFSLDSSISLIVRALSGRIEQFRNITNAVSIDEIRRWQEDMHWLFLILGFQFQQSSFDCISNLPEEMSQRCLSGYRSGEFIRVDFETLIQHCLTQSLDTNFDTKKLDPVTLITWYVFSWSVIEHNALENLGANAALISPELTRSSLWILARMITALSPHSFDFIENDTPEERARIEQGKLLPHIPMVSSAVLQQIVEFILKKVFTILTKMPGENKLCSDAIQLIILFADFRAEALGQSELFYVLLSHINIENLPSRRSLIKSLVIIGSVVTDEIRQKMYKTILESLEEKFLNLCAADSKDQTVAGKLTDLFECFAGVSDAGQSDAAPVLFLFLQPILQNSIMLLLKYPDSQLLVNSILEFYKSVTDILFFYIESSNDCAAFHNYLLSFISAYRQTQAHKYQTLQTLQNNDDLENRTKDLITLIEILHLSVSKTFMPTHDGAGSVENSAKVALLGLEIILPLMNEELLKIPNLCFVFFRLLLSVSDLAPNVMTQINEQMLNSFLQCIIFALDNHFGTERVKFALEIVQNVTSHLCANRLALHIIQRFVALMPKVFECALEYGYEPEVFNESSSALYSSICLDKDYFSAYVEKLLERPENVESADKLRIAFCKLLPESELLNIGIIEKRAFHDRLEKFLTEIYGLLYL